MMKLLKLLVVVLSLLTMAGLSQAYTIMDTYIGENDHGRGDVIGNPGLFDISRMEVNYNSGTLTVDIFSRYLDNVGAYNTVLGDLFISNNGYTPDVENWEFALVLGDPSNPIGGTASLYDTSPTTGTIRDAWVTNNLWVYRNGQEVQFVPNQNAPILATGTWSINRNGTLSDEDDYLRFIIAYNDWGFTDTIGFHWAMTCGNDVIEGGAPVPEPATMFLLGSGLIGLAGLGRRKFKKK
jgi:PEP-CTERM motif